MPEVKIVILYPCTRGSTESGRSRRKAERLFPADTWPAGTGSSGREPDLSFEAEALHFAFRPPVRKAPLMKYGAFHSIKKSAFPSDGPHLGSAGRRRPCQAALTSREGSLLQPLPRGPGRGGAGAPSHREPELKRRGAGCARSPSAAGALGPPERPQTSRVQARLSQRLFRSGFLSQASLGLRPFVRSAPAALSSACARSHSPGSLRPFQLGAQGGPRQPVLGVTHADVERDWLVVAGAFTSCGRLPPD